MKRITWILLCCTLLIFMAFPANASSRWIVDEAGLLTDQQIAELDTLAAQLVSEYQTDVVIVTVDSLGGKSSEQFADDYFDQNVYGYGPNANGILLPLSMEYRDWAISTCGETIYALTDYGIQELFGNISGFLAADAYYEGFTQYLMELDSYLDAFQNGSPIDGEPGGYQGPGSVQPGTQQDVVYYPAQKDGGVSSADVLIPLVVGLAAAGIALLVMRGKMNTARQQRGASSYVADGSYQLRQQRDLFLYSRTHKVRRSEDNNSHGGGSSVHRSSSGRSHGGGHGKF